ncbi:MAG TPA: hypothetical protein VJY66_03065 [Acholeplasma sp.]|nr:hypothetical protein [Acholeplasma sp.]
MDKEKDTKEPPKSVIKKGGLYENIDISKKGLSIAIITLSIILITILIIIAVRS